MEGGGREVEGGEVNRFLNGNGQLKTDEIRIRRNERRANEKK